MTSVSQATEIVAYVTGTNRSRVAQIARALIDGGVLPKSSGRDIKKVPADKLLSLLAAVVMSEKVADAVSVAKDFESLPRESAEDAGINGDTLSQYFSMLIRYDDVWIRPELELARTPKGFTATITAYVVNDSGEVEPLRPIAFWRHPDWGGFCKSSYIVSAEGIEVMQNLFKRDHVEDTDSDAPDVERDSE